MKFSLRLNNDLPIPEYVALAQAAEAGGFDQFWVSNDLFLRSVPVILAAVGQATTRIEIGTCVVNPYTIHPAEIAMMAATLDEISNGRFNLGIAVGGAELLKWINMKHTQPLATTRRAIAEINAILSGGTAEEWTPEAYLRFAPRRRVPIYLGAMGPKMLRLAGEVADGVLPLLFPPEHFATVRPLIAAGAAAAGRSMNDIDLAACIWVSISNDYSAAEAALREKIAYYGAGLSPLILDRLGVTKADFGPIEHAMMTERDPEKARALVTDRMLRIGVVGTANDLIARLDSLVAMGARHLSFGPPLGPDPLGAVEQLGRHIIPRFRG
ncbi:MAG: LLM class flavin-dependent oxidoreductase [Thermomicrobiales bacterium]